MASALTSTDELRLGILGMSEGNGHPYSWAAIFNGYDPIAMASCPFPAIPRYLAEQRFPEAQVHGARVTHIWAQDRSVAEHIAAASRIPTVVDAYRSMIGHVDAILLARDDAANHLAMSTPFLDAGLPVYIDKPIALDARTLDALYEHERYPGQIFSCSALRYSAAFQLNAEKRAELGEVHHIQAVVPNSWEKYGVHVVEPTLNMLNLYGKECDVQCCTLHDVQLVTAKWQAVSASFTCLKNARANIRISLFGTRHHADLVFTDPFHAFKQALSLYIDGVRARQTVIPKAQLYDVVSILEKGMAGAE